MPCSHALQVELSILELVSNLGALTFLCCLRRFIGRRELPKLIVSDHAKMFKATEKNLVTLFDLPDD